MTEVIFLVRLQSIQHDLRNDEGNANEETCREQGDLPSKRPIGDAARARSSGLRLYEQPFFKRALIKIRVCFCEAVELQDREDLSAERIRGHFQEGGRNRLCLSSPAPI